MAMTYTSLVASKSTAGSLKSWINRDTIDPDTILTEAQALIFETLRHWKMKAEATGTMTIGTPSIDLPADFIDSRDLRITGAAAARLKEGEERSVQDRYEYSGSTRVNQKPEWYYLSGLKARFDSPADAAYPYLLDYYQRPPPLSGTVLTNFLTADAPRLLRVACMLAATEFEKEVGQGQFDRTYWQTQFDKLLAELQAKSDLVDKSRDGPARLRGDLLGYSVLVSARSTAGSIKSWIGSDDIDPESILNEAQGLIYQTLRHWKMKADETATTTIGADSIALPADFIDSRELRITGIYASRIRKGDERSVQARWQYDGAGVRVNEQPQWYYLSGLAAVFDNPADRVYPLLLSYYARPAPLSADNLTNFLTTDAPRLLRTACMLAGAEFQKAAGKSESDPSYWQGQFDKLMAEFQAMSDVTDFAYEAAAEFA